MKKFLFILLTLALLLCACTPANIPGADTTKPSAGQITEPTGTEATTSENTFMLVQHKAGATYDGIDTANMKDGALYIINNGEVTLVATNPTVWCVSDQHIYYCTEDRPSMVRRCNRKGFEDEICFHNKQFKFRPYRIAHLQFNEELLVRLDSYHYDKHLFSYIATADMSESEWMQAYRIDEFTYASSSTAFPEVSAHISAEDLGATIYWKGKRNGNDTESRPYYSFIDRDECWDATTWKQVGYPQPTHPGSATKKDGSLYFKDNATEELRLVFDGPVVDYGNTYESVVFVKEAEPTKIYAAPIADLTQHRVIYESPAGQINMIYTDMNAYWKDVVQFVEDNKRFVWLDLANGEAELIMEQYYIEYADPAAIRDGFALPIDSWQAYNRFYFRGKLNEDEPIKEYLYYVDTGEIRETSR